MDKASLRRHLRMRLYALDESTIRQKSVAICETLVASINWNDIKKVSCYQSIASLREVDTSSVIRYVRDNLPGIRLDIVEPSKQTVLPQTLYDLIIVPVLGFDAGCNRLGRGGGWYDRFLSTQQTAIKIGLAFSCQMLDAVPIEEFDVELNDVVTEI